MRRGAQRLCARCGLLKTLGFLPDDVLRTVDGEPADGSEDIGRLLQGWFARERVSVDVTRNGKRVPLAWRMTGPPIPWEPPADPRELGVRPSVLQARAEAGIVRVGDDVTVPRETLIDFSWRGVTCLYSAPDDGVPGAYRCNQAGDLSPTALLYLDAMRLVSVDGRPVDGEAAIRAFLDGLFTDDRLELVVVEGGQEKRSVWTITGPPAQPPDWASRLRVSGGPAR